MSTVQELEEMEYQTQGVVCQEAGAMLDKAGDTGNPKVKRRIKEVLSLILERGILSSQDQQL